LIEACSKNRTQQARDKKQATRSKGQKERCKTGPWEQGARSKRQEREQEQETARTRNGKKKKKKEKEEEEKEEKREK